MPKRKTNELLFRLLELMDVRFFSRVSNQQPDGAVFVAQEQTYAARVLASLGYTQWAEFKLQSVIDNLDTNMDDFTQANAYRTLGYAREQSCAGIVSKFTRPILQESKTASASALALFVEIGKGCSNEAMFTHISLAQVTRKLGELEEAETHLAEAINVWQKTRKAEDQGGSKLILDLHQVLIQQKKFEEARELRQQHQRYFEESRVYYENTRS
jgi:tetratricopeptide (TPR) repeat protein